MFNWICGLGLAASRGVITSKTSLKRSYNLLNQKEERTCANLNNQSDNLQDGKSGTGDPDEKHEAKATTTATVQKWPLKRSNNFAVIGVGVKCKRAQSAKVKAATGTLCVP